MFKALCVLISSFLSMILVLVVCSLAASANLSFLPSGIILITCIFIGYAYLKESKTASQNRKKEIVVILKTISLFLFLTITSFIIIVAYRQYVTDEKYAGGGFDFGPEVKSVTITTITSAIIFTWYYLIKIQSIRVDEDMMHSEIKQSEINRNTHNSEDLTTPFNP